MSEHNHLSQVPGWALDADPARRPGVPMEDDEPHRRQGAHWSEPERQPPPRVPVLKRAELRELTPVFSQAVPPRGLSGLVRRWAYHYPEHLTRKWLLLLVADRVDVWEERLKGPPQLLGATLVAGGALALWRLARR